MASSASLFSSIDYFSNGRLSSLEAACTGTWTPHDGLPFNHRVAHGDPNEDRIGLRFYPAYGGRTALWAIDGVTSVTDWRYESMPAGWHAARLTNLRISQDLGPGTHPEELWEAIENDLIWFAHFNHCPPTDLPRATVTLFNPFVADRDHLGEIWTVGDGLFGWQTADGTWVPCADKYPANSVDALNRANAILGVMRDDPGVLAAVAPLLSPAAQQALPVTDHELLTNLLNPEAWGAPVIFDTVHPAHRHRFPRYLKREEWGRLHKLGWAYMQQERRARKLQEANGLLPPTPAKTMTAEEWSAGFRRTKVPRDTVKLMIGTDGTQIPCRSRPEAFYRLEQQRLADPLCIGIPLSLATLPHFREFLHLNTDGDPEWLCHPKGFIGEDGREHAQLDDLGFLIADMAGP